MNTQWIRNNLGTVALICLALYAPILFGVFYTTATMHISYNASTAFFVAIAPGILLLAAPQALLSAHLGASPGFSMLVLSVALTLALIGVAVACASRSRNALAWTTLGSFGLSSVLAAAFVALQRM